MSKLGFLALNQISKKEENYDSMPRQAVQKLSENIDTLLQKEVVNNGGLRPASETHQASAFHQTTIGSFKEDSGCPDAAEHSSSMRGALFRNNGAKQSFLIWALCGVRGACSVIELARLDA